MRAPFERSVAPVVLGACALFFACGAGGATAPSADVPGGGRGGAVLRLEVDGSQPSRRMLHVREDVPVRPGPVVLVYPKWIPGEHGPTGPIGNVAGLTVRGGGKPLAWERDAVDMFTLRVTAPAGVTSLELEFDYLLASDGHGMGDAASQTDSLVTVSWNQLVFYPAGRKADDVWAQATLKLPADFRFGTALPVESEAGPRVTFKPVSLVTLIDAPVSAGRYYRRVALGEVAGRPHTLHLVADSAAALAAPEETLEGYRKLVREAVALFGAPHYGRYEFLYTLSDHIAWFGLEHHESSDNREGERALVDEGRRKLGAGLLPHELVHSWNGKYRRPVGLLTPDYQTPHRTALLWVYEGLTSYLGDVLTARSGLWSKDDYLESLAVIAASLDRAPGRAWRPLLDTAVGAQVLLDEGQYFRAYRRGLDYYDEGELLWLEADVVIRTQTKGARTLDDFCKRFFGGEATGARVVGYTEDDVLKALEATAPYDWRTFWSQRLRGTDNRAPLGGIEAGGYKLVYDDKPTDFVERREELSGPSFLASLGFRLDKGSVITDVSPASPAGRASLAPGSMLLGVNGRRYSADRLRDAIRAAAETRAPVELLVENGETFRTVRLEYTEGLRYPRLERKPGTEDVLGSILAPRAPAGGTK